MWSKLAEPRGESSPPSAMEKTTDGKEIGGGGGQKKLGVVGALALGCEGGYFKFLMIFWK